MASVNWEQSPGKIGVFLVDRNKFFRQYIRAALMRHDDIEVLGESDIDSKAFGSIQGVPSKVVVVDINPPLLSGIDLTRKITQYLPGTSTILVSPYCNDSELVHAATAGAAAYLSKTIESTEIAGIIRRVADGELLMVESLISRPPVLERVLRHFHGLSIKEVTMQNAGPITERESEVLSYVSRGYGNKQIANVLGISEQTIKNHMTSIMSKLDASDRTHAVVMAMQHGLISASPEAK